MPIPMICLNCKKPTEDCACSFQWVGDEGTLMEGYTVGELEKVDIDWDLELKKLLEPGKD